ncbi:MAG: leucine-rich repeat domain-containing protein [Eggerthellaceae bacterium]|nr:leucine-rich repeat domain-containing protein [Eggerthellaceae bacterium]
MALGDGVISLAMLGVTFGGFSPTLMDGVEKSKEQVERFEEIAAQRKETLRKQREMEFARTSKEQTYVDDSGNEWKYVVVDNAVARIVRMQGAPKFVTIPSEIEGYQVYAIGSEALSENDALEEIVCPDTVSTIGACAFRFNSNLRRVVLPANVAEFQSGWVRHCPKLEELVLPGLLDEIKLNVLENESLRKLWIGKNVYMIEPGAFQNTALEEIVVDPENPFISNDGIGLYSKDYSVLYALALPVERYAVKDGCRKLAKKSCYGIEALKHIELPSSVVELDPYALSHSGLESFDAPSSLVSIGEKAFYYCRRLERVALNEGLETIGNSAFEESGLDALYIPATIKSIGNSITTRTNVIHSGPDCSLAIDPACEKLFLDGEGGLYRIEDNGSHMLQLVDRDMREYRVYDGAVAIDEYAFAFHDNIEKVIVPQSVRSIGRNAFRICRNLKSVELPDTIRSIGSEAFLDTQLEAFRVPEQLSELGENALVTYGSHHGDYMPSLASIEVAPGNETFYMACGMLCRRTGDGANVIMFTSSEKHVVFPDEITRVEEFAFNNARGIDYLSLNPRLATIGTCGLSTWCWIRHIHIDLDKPLEGRTSYDFFFPDTEKSIHGISLGIGGSSWVNVPNIMAQYDNCIVNARDYNAPRKPDNISAYEQAKLILARFEDPIMLTEVNRGMFERLLRNYIIEICVDIARHDDRAALNALVDRGYINEGNLEDIIAEVGKLQDAAMTAHLLEVKRLKFNRAIVDFDL